MITFPIKAAENVSDAIFLDTLIQDLANENEITDVPAVFKYGGVIPTQAVMGEGIADETATSPGFTAFSSIIVMLFIIIIKKRVKSRYF
jgi:hypothetical protein